MSLPRIGTVRATTGDMITVVMHDNGAVADVFRFLDWTDPQPGQLAAVMPCFDRLVACGPVSIPDDDLVSAAASAIDWIAGPNATTREMGWAVLALVQAKLEDAVRRRITQSLDAAMTAHQRVGIGGCSCGWNKLGASFTGHVSQVLRAATGAR